MINWIKSNITKNIKVGNPSIRGEQNKHMIEYIGLQSYKILNWIYNGSTSETRLDRKYERYIKYLKEVKSNG